MKRRAFLGTALAGLPLTTAFAAQPKLGHGHDACARGGPRVSELRADGPVAVERGVPNQAIKVFGKANLLRSLSPGTCLRYALSQPGTPIAICGCGTVGQMVDDIRAVQDFRKMTLEESAEVRKRAIVGGGVYTGTILEYWKKRA